MKSLAQSKLNNKFIDRGKKMAEPITAATSVAILAGLKAACAAKGVSVGLAPMGTVVTAYLTGGSTAAINAAYATGIYGFGALVSAFFGK